jgi:TonB family protein
MAAVGKEVRKTMEESRTTLREACPLLRSKSFPRLRPIVIFALGVCGLGMSFFHDDAVAQQNQPARREREIVSRVEPIYPEIARHVRLKGGVRLQVQVAADGSVASIQVLGGNPLFVKAGVEAIGKWRWAKASDNTEELVRLTFENP